MKIKGNTSRLIYAALFALAVAAVGASSFGNLMDFYVNGKVDYNEWSARLGSKFETDIATTFFQKFQFVNLNGLVRNVLGQREMNGVIKLGNGYLVTAVPRVGDERLREHAERLSAVNEYARKRGTSLVLALAPDTPSKYDPQLPRGVSYHGNDNADRLLALLKAEGIDIIDFREQMRVSGRSQYDFMYRTDHHWTTEAGFFAYRILERYIAEKTGCAVDGRISDFGNYTTTTYRKWHLGSRGQRTGRFFAGIDDFDLILPKFDTLIQNEAGKTGRLEDMAINRKPLERRDETSRYTYDTVLNNTLGHYRNKLCTNTTRILLITDSFGKAVAPYLIMGFSEINCIRNSDVSSVTPEYIEAYNPDVIILLHYLPNAMREGAYNFGGFSLN